MSNEIKERFRLLDSSILIHYAAFQLQDYSLEAQGLLRTVLFERGIGEAEIKAYRLKRFPFPTMDVVCGNCGEPLTIERQELNDGTFTCPECHVTEAVPYPEISIDEDKSVFTGREVEEIASNAVSGGAAAAFEIPSDPMKALGQGGGIPKIGAGFVKPMDEVRLMEEGLPDTVCAKCGTVLEPDNTFIARDDFYCEKCYNEIPESEREISSEESS